MNQYFKKNQILSLTCLPISPNELLILVYFDVKIPQFDILTLGVQVFNLVTLFCVFYYLNIKYLIPLSMEIKKFRIKKYKKSFFFYLQTLY